MAAYPFHNSDDTPELVKLDRMTAAAILPEGEFYRLFGHDEEFRWLPQAPPPANAAVRTLPLRTAADLPGLEPSSPGEITALPLHLASADACTGADRGEAPDYLRLGRAH